MYGTVPQLCIERWLLQRRGCFSLSKSSGQDSFIGSSKSIAIMELFPFCRVSHIRRNTSPCLAHFRVPQITLATYLLFNHLFHLFKPTVFLLSKADLIFPCVTSSPQTHTSELGDSGNLTTTCLLCWLIGRVANDQYMTKIQCLLQNKA